jgi:hypothetical protein
MNELGTDPNPDAGIGGDESETVPTDPAPPDEEGGGESEDQEPTEVDAEPAEVAESVGDAPLDDEDGSNDQGDAGGEE